MSIQPTSSTLKQFSDINGKPLELGFVYIGQEGLDPKTNPINVFWDKEHTQIATQPIRTKGGYPINGSSNGILFLSETDYSITVQNKNEHTLFTSLSSTVIIGFDDASESLADPSAPYYIKRTDNPNLGVQTALHVENIFDFISGQIGIAGLFDAIQTGPASGGAAHVPALIGRATNNSLATMPMWGVEGKIIDVSDTHVSNFPFFAIYQRNNNIDLGSDSVSLFGGFAELTEADGTTPDATGEVIYFDATTTGTGGDAAKMFALKGNAGKKIETGDNITAYGTTSEVKVEATLGGRKLSLSHNDTSGSITQSDTNQDLGIYPGRYLIQENGLGFVPRTEGTDLGINFFRWEVFSTSMNIKEDSAPATPVSGSVVLYAKTDGKLYYKDDGGTEHEIATV